MLTLVLTHTCIVLAAIAAVMHVMHELAGPVWVPRPLTLLPPVPLPCFRCAVHESSQFNPGNSTCKRSEWQGSLSQTTTVCFLLLAGAEQSACRCLRSGPDHCVQDGADSPAKASICLCSRLSRGKPLAFVARGRCGVGVQRQMVSDRNQTRTNCKETLAIGHMQCCDVLLQHNTCDVPCGWW